MLFQSLDVSGFIQCSGSVGPATFWASGHDPWSFIYTVRILLFLKTDKHVGKNGFFFFLRFTCSFILFRFFRFSIGSGSAQTRYGSGSLVLILVLQGEKRFSLLILNKEIHMENKMFSLGSSAMMFLIPFYC